MVTRGRWRPQRPPTGRWRRMSPMPPGRGQVPRARMHGRVPRRTMAQKADGGYSALRLQLPGPYTPISLAVIHPPVRPELAGEPSGGHHHDAAARTAGTVSRYHERPCTRHSHWPQPVARVRRPTTGWPSTKASASKGRSPRRDRCQPLVNRTGSGPSDTTADGPSISGVSSKDLKRAGGATTS